MNRIELIKEILLNVQSRYGVCVVLKDFYSIIQISSDLLELIRCFYGHCNPYCLYIKSNKYAENECRRVEHTGFGRIMNSDSKKYSNGGFMKCPYGVCEFYYPIHYSDRIIGAIVIGSSPCNTEDFDELKTAVCSSFGFSEKELEEKYIKYIRTVSVPDSPDMFREVAACGELLSMICEKELSYIDIDKLFISDILLDISNVYIDNAMRNRMLSKNNHGENNRMTIILNAIFYVLDNYANPITIDGIAKYCYCSPSTLSHIFAKSYGMTINELIRNVRCDHAKLLLTNSSMSIEQISLSCGFTSPDYFTTVFKSINNMTPTAYRLLSQS